MAEGDKSESLEAKDSVMKPDNEVDIVSLFRGSATVALVALLVSAITMLGSYVAFLVSRPGGIIENIEADVAIFLIMVGAMFTLFFFLAAIGFFVRFNRRLGRFILSDNLGSVNINRPGVKTVIVIYGLAVGLILIMGMWGYWLAYKYILADILSTTQSISFLAFLVSAGIFLLAVLVLIVLAALGRTATTMVKKVLGVKE
jgi:hypothetical protein